MLALFLAAAAFTPSATARSAQTQISVRIIEGTRVTPGVSSQDQITPVRRTLVTINGTPQPARLVEFQ
ncbi:MAG: hypothetical protein ABR588_00150 [Sphingomicrobium sp.]